MDFSSDLFGAFSTPPSQHKRKLNDLTTFPPPLEPIPPSPSSSSVSSCSSSVSSTSSCSCSSSSSPPSSSSSSSSSSSVTVSSSLSVDSLEQNNIKKSKIIDCFDKYEEQKTERVFVSGSDDSNKNNFYDITYPPNWGKASLLTTTTITTTTTTTTTTKPTDEPVIKFDFKLDPFQANAIKCIEQNLSVFVSAHTSAGKTVVAQYAIAQALKKKSRVIYTSPIKALSNQKYRELKDRFEDVGLLTGDTVLDPEAGCLVMTTEIVREMLYQGSLLMSEVSWIIFDEIHYMGHKERGVVWEETIILLPHSIRYVFLSATLPNSLELAQWVSKLHHQPVALVGSEYRPTPLCHYFFPSGGDGLYMVYDAKKQQEDSRDGKKSGFLVDGFNNAMVCLEASKELSGLELKGQQSGNGVSGSSSNNSGSSSSSNSSSSNSGSSSSNSGSSSSSNSGNSNGSGSSSGSSGGSSSGSRNSDSSCSNRGDGNNNSNNKNIANNRSTRGRGGGPSKGARGGGRGGKSKRKGGGGGGGKGKSGGGGADIFALVKLILQQKMEPVILFNFSKQECEIHAMSLSKLDATDDEEKHLIRTIFEGATQSLAQHDRMLTQIQNILPLLLRGIGLHHGGLLPVLKEVTEILFGERLLKVLIATETFAMGINMPARSVVFTSLSKFDGDEHRMLTPGEYTQMSGRAGRRGLDDRGFAIAVVEEPMEEADARQLVCGEAMQLDSQFALRFSMILNITRLGSSDPEFLMRRSFRQFQLGVKQALLRKELQEAQAKALAAQTALAEAKTEGLEEYFSLRSEIEAKGNRLRRLFYDPIYAGPFLEPGRVVEIRSSDGGGVWGIVVKYYKKRSQELEKKLYEEKISCSIDPSGLEHMLEVLLPLKEETCTIETVSLKAVLSLSSIKLFLPKELHSSVPIQNYTLKSIDKLQEGFPDGLPAVDPFADLGFPRNDTQMQSLISEIESLEKRLFKMPIAKRAQRSCRRFGWFEEQKRWTEKSLQLEKKLQAEAAEVSLSSKHKGMLVVLKRLGYLTSEGVVDVKGRVACLISTCDEIAACELLMHGGFHKLTAPQLCALLSCVVNGVRPKKDAPPTDVSQIEGLAAPLALLKDVVTRVGQVMVDARLLEDSADYVDSFQPLMAEVVYHWATGMSFQEVCARADNIFEGQIVRVIRHVADILRQMSLAAKMLGDSGLEANLSQASRSLQRDIVFACSLYL